METNTSAVLECVPPKTAAGRRQRETHSKVAPRVSKISSEALIDDDEFTRRMQALQQLQAAAKRAYMVALSELLKFAVEYTTVYKTVARDSERVAQLNEALGLDYAASTRWRCIAAAADRLEPIQTYLPPALEPLYEVTLALKQDEALVRKAIDQGQLTPESTLRDIRALRHRERDHGRASRDCRMSVRKLANLVVHVTIPQDRVLRSDDVLDLQQRVEAALRDRFDVRCIEVGVEDTSGRWIEPWELRRHLDTYWQLKDEAEALKITVETQAIAMSGARENTTAMDQEAALRESREAAWNLHHERRGQLQDQFAALFAP